MNLYPTRKEPELSDDEFVPFGPRRPGCGVPMLEWRCREYGEHGEYEGHAFVTMDPKGIARSVCNGFIDDMEWITLLHNGVIGNGWRARLVRRLLNIPKPVERPV